MGDRRTTKGNEKIVKRKPIKRSRPLCTEELLAEDRLSYPEGGLLPSSSSSSTAAPATATTTTTTTTTVSIEMGRKSTRNKDKDKKKRGPVKERWLLTRKTWRYMADAGRRLIPEGVQNRPEDVPKLEEYFQQVCRSEPRFLLWRRKCSYPGARASSRNTKWREKGATPKGIRLGPDPPDEQTQNADQIITILKDYLNLKEEKKTAMLLGTKTVRPDQTESPSAQRPPASLQSATSKLPSSDLSRQQQRANDITAQINELLDRLRSYSQSCSRSILSPDMITTDILNNKALLKRIYTELKKQQLHRILGKHSSRPPNLPHSSSLTSLWNLCRESGGEPKGAPSTYPSDANNTSGLAVISVKRAPLSPVHSEKKYSTIGTQTDFIPLHVLQRMSKEYEAQRREEELLNRQTDEDCDKGTYNHSRRKSSVDNEDVSQSVSDTIKRYLRMARKKSVADDNANRFKRVNYDRNLRNIRAKGEINPPGMDEGSNKAVQTLDAWPVIALGYIRGADNTRLLEEAHAAWRTTLQKRIQQKEEYEEQLRQQQKEQSKTSGHSNPPPSPQHPHQPSGTAGIFHSGTQFLSNLLYGHHHSAHDSSNALAKSNPTLAQRQQQPSSLSQPNIGPSGAGSEGGSGNGTGTMQKSKSSSNVGQFVSKKIWRSRSKSQTRTSSPSKPEWTPQGNCIWTSGSGKKLVLADTKLQDLTEIERKVLHRVAIEKINQLNIGVSVTAPGDSSGTPSKPQKRRPLLIKRKALTTGFFDSGKKSDNKGSGERGGLVFGVSLEKCLDNDNRIHRDPSISDQGLRNSISSVLADSPKTIGSCESLPLRSNYFGQDDSGSLLAPSPIPASHSQSDVRRTSQEEEELGASGVPPMAQTGRSTQQVPGLVMACIKHLEEHGLHTVGIFRVSTSKKRVKKLREDFDRGDVTVLDPDICPHDVATLLKEYLRDLPEPLICRNLYKAFVKTQKIRNRRLQLEALSHLVQLLPVAHRDTLYALLKFLAKIVRSSDDITSRDGTILSVGNKMDSNNLATVFAPNILRCTVSGQGTSEQEIDDQIDVINVIRTMIDHYEELFRVPAELLDEVYTNMMDTFPQQLDYLCEKRDIIESDGMDSATSVTPISSPPPMTVSMMAEFGNSKPAQYTQQSSIVESPKQTAPPRRIYSREDFLHENAAKGDPNGNGFMARRRDRISKMKYVENEHEMIRRRRRDRFLATDTAGSSGSNSSTVSTGVISKQQQPHLYMQMVGTNGSSSIGAPVGETDFHSMHQQRRSSSSDTGSRRLSSPFVLRSTGVVTASLQIPVQMQSGASICQQMSGYPDRRDSSTRSSTQLDLSDIPFIEDSSDGGQIPITGTLSFGGGRKDSLPSNTYQIPISYEGRMLNTPSGSSSTSPESVRPPPFTQGPTGGSTAVISVSTKKPDMSTKRAGQSSKKNSASNPSSPKPSGDGTYDNQGAVGLVPLNVAGSVQQPLTSHIEPKITPTISSIGGAVLRSKTADFERMLTQSKKHKSGASDDLLKSSSTTVVSDGPNGGGGSGVGVSGGGNDKSRRPSQGPIYKRQELISSAKRSSK